jgi:DNA-binding HxlR family transcriptional regulator
MLEIIRSKWTTRVLLALSDGTLRFNELRGVIGGVSQKMLALVLRQLESDGLVLRVAYATIPPRVDYALTERGRRSAEALRQLEQVLFLPAGTALAPGVRAPSSPSHTMSIT